MPVEQGSGENKFEARETNCHNSIVIQEVSDRLGAQPGIYERTLSYL